MKTSVVNRYCNDTSQPHCDKPGSIYIGRGSMWGNPFTHLDIAKTKAMVQVPTRQASIKAFREWIRGDSKWLTIDPQRRMDIIKNVHQLKGKILACYCAPLPCHGDVLAEMADAERVHRRDN